MIHAVYLKPKDEEPSNYWAQEVIHVCRGDELPPTQTTVKYGDATCK